MEEAEKMYRKINLVLGTLCLLVFFSTITGDTAVDMVLKTLCLLVFFSTITGNTAVNLVLGFLCLLVFFSTITSYAAVENVSDELISEDPNEKIRGSLQDYLEYAKICDAEITGENPQNIPDSRFIVDDQRSNNIRVKSIAQQVNDTNEYNFYVIGKNFTPNGKVIAEWFGSEFVYSNSLEKELQIGEDFYSIARMGIQRKSSGTAEDQEWIIESKNDPTCLGKGKIIYMNNNGIRQEVILAPLGHIDENRDSICDRCQMRAIPQKEGDTITAALQDMELTFTCIDDDYGGGMLYLADDTVPLSFFGGYGSVEYGSSKIYQYFRDGFQNGFSIKNGVLGIQVNGTNGVSYAMSLSKTEYEKYRDQIKGGKFLLRDSSNGSIIGVDENGSYQVENPENTEYGIRIAIVLEKPEEGQPDKIHWNIGDVQACEIDGEIYMFRCIDQNYVDGSENHRQSALFLCDTIIPANYGSTYQIQQMEDGSHQYVFVPGPIVNFGSSNDYKYSKIRKWLGANEIFNTEPISIGIDYAFIGKTAEKSYADFNGNTLKSSYIGSQKLNEQLFILSVDEAVRYKDVLWKFEGSEVDNPDTQYAAFSKGYWLRSPMGTSENYDTGYVYVVDIVDGNIHAELTRPCEETGNDELNITAVYGIRPAFTMPQN